MNKRLKKLEKQCWSHRINGVLVDGHLHFDTEKFAELIVKECADQAYEFITDPDNERYYDVIGRLNIPGDTRRHIKKYFGVE